MMDTIFNKRDLDYVFFYVKIFQYTVSHLNIEFGKWT
jgi:hypothetical protein